jgi:hypothetical protein
LRNMIPCGACARPQSARSFSTRRLP